VREPAVADVLAIEANETVSVSSATAAASVNVKVARPLASVVTAAYVFVPAALLAPETDGCSLVEATALPN